MELTEIPNTITRLKNVSEELIIEATARRQKIKEANKKVAASLDKHYKDMNGVIAEGSAISSTTQKYLEEHGYLKDNKEEIAEIVGKELAGMSLSKNENFFSREAFKYLLGREQMVAEIFSKNDKLKNLSLKSNGQNNFSIIDQDGNEIMKLEFSYENGITFIVMFDSKDKDYNPKKAVLFVGINDDLNRDNNEIRIFSKDQPMYSYEEKGKNQRITFSVDGNEFAKDDLGFSKLVNDNVEIITEQDFLNNLNKFNPEMVQIYEEKYHYGISKSNESKRR